MTRAELEQAIRAACDVSGDDEVYVFGSRFNETVHELNERVPLVLIKG